jgi:hypothetical protein
MGGAKLTGGSRDLGHGLEKAATVAGRGIFFQRCTEATRGNLPSNESGSPTPPPVRRTAIMVKTVGLASSDCMTAKTTA